MKTVFVVEWWAPGKGINPEGDITVEALQVVDDGFPKNYSRGRHYQDYFSDAERAYRYAENIQKELGIKALFGTYEKYLKEKEYLLQYLLDVEEVEVRRRNNNRYRPIRLAKAI
jgi:hypothetical protein